MKISEKQRDDNYFNRKALGIGIGFSVSATPIIKNTLDRYFIPISDKKLNARISKIGEEIGDFDFVYKIAEKIIEKNNLRETGTNIVILNDFDIPPPNKFSQYKNITEYKNNVRKYNLYQVIKNGLDAQNAGGTIKISNKRGYSYLFHEI